jgi:chemosensory pili system protein ChpA (sensor histidine kinase/response regulator)
MPFNSECLQLSNQVLTTGQESYLWEDELLPLIRLDHYLHINCHQRETYLQYRPSGASQSVVIVNQNEQRCALIVEACWGLHQGVMQQVSGDINLPTPFIGCFMINNRQVVPVLNPEFLQEILV